MPSANEIRQQFIDFFVKKHGHTFVPSSSVVPLDDPTLLFTNAGMNQFKDVFLGTGTRPYKRAVEHAEVHPRRRQAQRPRRRRQGHLSPHLLRDARQLVASAITSRRKRSRWAWELLTEVWELDKTRLHATVFEGDAEQGLARDDEAVELWQTETDIDPSHIHLGNKKDNFWEMGETGPCGPCTEIHYRPHAGQDAAASSSTRARRTSSRSGTSSSSSSTATPDKKLTPLPAKHVDTGMGFERVTAVLQGKASNYDTDVFTPIFDAIQQGDRSAAVRRQARRSEGHGLSRHRRPHPHADLRAHRRRGAGQRGPRATSCAASCAGRSAMAGSTSARRSRSCASWCRRWSRRWAHAFPELKQQPEPRGERHPRGRRELHPHARPRHQAVSGSGGRGAQERQAASSAARMRSSCTTPTASTSTSPSRWRSEVGPERRSRRITTQRWRRHRTDPARARKKLVITAVQGDLPKTDDSPKYGGLIDRRPRSLGWVKDNAVVAQRPARTRTTRSALLLDRTNFYAEQGGQVGDAGIITTPTGRFEVEDTQKLGDARPARRPGRRRAASRPDSRRRSKSAATGRTPCATTPPRTCSTGRCARCSASTSSRRARSSMPRRRASTSPTTSR